MGVSEVLDMLTSYGVFFIFVIVFLEYLNLPGFPGGVILPVAGIWAYSSEINLLLAVIISVIAGVSAGAVLYAIGKYGGHRLLEYLLKKFPKIEPKIRIWIEKLMKQERKTIFIAKLLPSIRTLIDFPAGVLEMDFKYYLGCSALGISIWNFCLMAAGYFFSDIVLAYIG